MGGAHAAVSIRLKFMVHMECRRNVVIIHTFHVHVGSTFSDSSWFHAARSYSRSGFERAAMHSVHARRRERRSKLLSPPPLHVDH